MLNKIFNPESIAIIGASNVIGKWGFIIPLNILTNGYKGKLYLINPTVKKVLGLRAYKKLTEIPTEIDLAIITIPARFVPEAIKECGKKGIPYVMVISSNFAEASEEGARLEKEIVSIAALFNTRIIGPNTMGIYSASSSLLAIGPSILPLPGKVGLISQSGNIGVQILTLGVPQKIGFSKFVGSGNEADLTTADYLEYLGDDPETEIIALYIESIKKGEQFYNIAKRISRNKPIIALKTAKTSAGERAALSHTAALTTKKEVTEAIFKQCGIIEVETTDELIDVIKALLRLPIPRGDKVGIITLGGGWGVVATEACAKYGLEIPQFHNEEIEKLNNILPPFWSKQNPADLVGVVNRKVHFEALQLITAADNINAVISLGMLIGRFASTKELIRRFVTTTINFYRANFKAALLFLPTFIRSIRKSKKEVGTEYFKKSGGSSGGINLGERGLWRDRVFCKVVNDLIRKYNKPIIAVSSDYHRSVSLAYWHNTVAYHTPEKAAFVLSKLVNYGKFLNKKEEVVDKSILNVDIDKVKKLINNKQILNEYESKKILDEYQIPVVKETLISSFIEAKKKVKEIEYPVVLKILSSNILHRAQKGLIELNINNEEELKSAYERILNTAKVVNAKVDGVLLQEMIKGEKIEVIIGINYDKCFGQVIMFGLGGVFTEVLEDVTFRKVPVDKEEAYQMIKEIKGYKILKNVDIDQLSEIIVKVSQVATSLKDYIKELDINPLIISKDLIKVVDALIVTFK